MQIALVLLSVALLAPTVSAAQTINFGNNSSQWADDGECDDRRFRGVGMDIDLDRDDNFKDAKDCRAAYEDGRIKLWVEAEAKAATQCAAINFGDDSGEWVRDGECDDPRFEGAGTSTVVKSDDIRKDAKDCRAACIQGRVFIRDY